jgi:hypothetical protein
MEFRIRKTGKVISEQEFRKLHSNTSFPEILTDEILNSFDVDPVLEGPQVITTPPYEISVRQGIEEINGKWFTKYVVGPIFVDTEDKTAEEQKKEYKEKIDVDVASSVRKQRNELLSKSDWIVSVSVENEVTVPKIWKEYRQALRDIPNQKGFPHNVVWPDLNLT